jgi:hypothetical protein
METGAIAKVIPGKGYYVFVPCSDTYKLEQKGITEVFVEAPDPRKISPAQRNKIFALINDIGEHISTIKKKKEYEQMERELGLLYVVNKMDNEAIRRQLTLNYCRLNNMIHFSLSNTDMTTAREFIDWLVEMCIEFDIPCNDTLLNRCEDVDRYMYLCIAKRKCCICGSLRCDIHHCQGSVVGMGNDRKDIHNLGRKCLPLCRKHHSECEQIGQTAFNEKYHVYGIRLDEYLCKKIGWRV